MLPDLPVATHALNSSYFSEADKMSMGELKVGIVEHFAGRHLIIGDISKRNLNGANWRITEMLIGSAPEEWNQS